MKPVPVLALLAAAVVWSNAAEAVDVYKWTDSKGVVHYGDRRPAASASAVVLRVPDDEASEEDEEAANERLDQAREKILEPTQDGGDPVVHPMDSRRKKAHALGCAESWQRYDEAVACFGAHRVASGKGVTSYGTAVCKEVPQPACAR